MPPAEPVFVDTSGWIALLNADDQFHSAAAALMGQFQTARRRIVTTDWVLAETGNGLARTRARAAFANAVKTMLASPQFRLVRVTEELFQLSLEHYHRAEDKTWGWIDCASFLVMEREGIRDAMTTDTHFEQAGFRRLLAAVRGRSESGER